MVSDLYDPASVVWCAIDRRRDAPKNAGEICAAAFELYDDGATVHEVCKTLRIEAKRARDLYAEWGTPSGHTVKTREDREAELEAEHQATLREMRAEQAATRAEAARRAGRRLDDFDRLLDAGGGRMDSGKPRR